MPKKTPTKRSKKIQQKHVRTGLLAFLSATILLGAYFAETKGKEKKKSHRTSTKIKLTSPKKEFFSMFTRLSTRFGVFAVFLAVLFGGAFYIGQADVAKFYAHACLGGWENPRNAEGAPNNPENARFKDFDKSNSAVLRDVASQIFCGDFSSDANEGVPERVIVRFSWDVVADNTSGQTLTYKANASFDETVEGILDLPDDSTLELVFEDDTTSGDPAPESAEQASTTPKTTATSTTKTTKNTDDAGTEEKSVEDNTGTEKEDPAETAPVEEAVIDDEAENDGAQESASNPDSTNKAGELEEAGAEPAPASADVPPSSSGAEVHPTPNDAEEPTAVIGFWKKLSSIVFKSARAQGLVSASSTPSETPSAEEPSDNTSTTTPEVLEVVSATTTPTTSDGTEVRPAPSDGELATTTSTQKNVVDPISAPATSTEANATDTSLEDSDDSANVYSSVADLLLSGGPEPVGAGQVTAPDGAGVYPAPNSAGQATSTATTTTGLATSTNAIATSTVEKNKDTNAPPKPRPGDFLQVLYTLDGVAWKTLGFVGIDNWEGLSFDIPITKWDDLSKVQVSLQSIPSLDSVPIVYLDSIWIEVESSKFFEVSSPSTSIGSIGGNGDEGSETHIIEGSVDNKGILISEKKSFTADEDVIFDININALQTAVILTEPQNTASTSSLVSTTSPMQKIATSSPQS